MKIKFSCLEEGDKIWYVYNENYKEWNYNLPYNVKEVLKSCIVLKNKKIKIEKSSSDRFNDHTWTVVENRIEIETEFGIYRRNYDDFYDNKGQMTISGEVFSNNPRIEVFTTKEAAIKYIEVINLRNIEMLNEEIQNRQKQIELCKQSIKNAKKEYE